MNKMSGFSRLWQGPEVEPALDLNELKSGGPVAGSVFCAVSLPPPLHGQSMVNAAIVRAAQNFAGPDKVEVADIGPGQQTIGLKYHLTRAFRVARAAMLLAKRGFKANRRLYTVFESGLGIGYNFLLIGTARLFGYNIILLHHTSKHTLTRQLRFEVLQRLAGPSCLHIVLSEEMAKNMRLIYPKTEKVLVSQNACHIQDCDLEGRTSALPNKLRIGFLSNLCPEKGLDVVVETAAICRRKGLELTFVFAGPTLGRQSAELLAKAREELGDYIEVLGPVVDGAKADFFKSIDVFLFPTRYRYEAQPLVVLEAMSYGLPVITTRCGYVAELVGSHGVVLDVDERLPRRIVEHLQKLLVNHEYSRWKSLEARLYFRGLRAAAMGQLRELMNDLFSVTAKDHAGPASLS